MRTGRLAVAAVLGSASLAVWTPGAGVAAQPRAGTEVSWGDLRSDLEDLAAAAELYAPQGPAVGARDAAVVPAATTAEVERALRGLDGAAAAGAAAAVWRQIFGGGASVLAPTSAGPPLRQVAFPDAEAGRRFLRKRLDQARAQLQGRSGPAGTASALHPRLQNAVQAMRDGGPRPFSVGECGPVRVEASGDTVALAQICADLDSYWPQAAEGTGGAVVRLHPVRAGSLPTPQRHTTAALSTVEPVLADLLSVAGATAPATTPANQAQAPAGDPAATERAPVDPPRREAGPAPRADLAQTPTEGAAGSQEVPVAVAPSAEATPPEGAGSTDASRPQAWAPVLAAAREPRTWTTALGAIAALVAGAWIFSRGRELTRSRARWGRAA